MNYSQLIAASTSAGSIANWLNHSSLVAVAPNIVEEAESAIYRRLRHFRMLTPVNGTMTTSQSTVTLPTDYLEDKLFFLTGTAFGRVPRKTLDEVIANYSYDGTGVRVKSRPNMFFNDSANINFDTIMDQTYLYTLYYYQQPVALSTSNTTNFLTSTYPRLVRVACMTAAAEFMKDIGVGNYDRMYWAQMTEEEIDKAQRESDRSQHTVEAGMILQ